MLFTQEIIIGLQVGTFTLEYFPMHYGHDMDMECQNLTKQEKKWILELVMRGWNSSEIVKTLREGVIQGYILLFATSMYVRFSGLIIIIDHLRLKERRTGCGKWCVKM